MVSGLRALVSFKALTLKVANRMTRSASFEWAVLAASWPSSGVNISSTDDAHPSSVFAPFGVCEEGAISPVPDSTGWLELAKFSTSTFLKKIHPVAPSRMMMRNNTGFRIAQ